MSVELLPTGKFSFVTHAQHGFQSPTVVRRQMSKEMVAAHTIRKSRRAKSTEPNPANEQEYIETKTEMVNDNKTIPRCISKNNPATDLKSEKPLLTLKPQESMSKSELINCYRLLMSEKLRLERFLSIVTKNNEMARNRLESDLLDAMMCIEDLKQALELRMARRSKIDPREAEERRYLIRQNKKLLNQLYESAKKIEKLELTKVEMKEQLELLDFQILEIENQKALMEEELRKQPACNYVSVQTENDNGAESQLATQLRKQLSATKSELCHQKAETAAVLAKHQHLENLVRELRRDNVELRDQLAKLDDTENSLAESDKSMAHDARSLQAQLETQLELIRELESKLKASRDYSDDLESRLRTMNDKSATAISSDQAAMHEIHENANPPSGFRVPHVDDLMLQETIRTFHTLIAERDQEIAQLMSYIRRNQLSRNSGDSESIVLPDLFESAAQTDLGLEDSKKVSHLLDLIADGGIVISSDERCMLGAQLRQVTEVITSVDSTNEAGVVERKSSDTDVTVPQIVSALRLIQKHFDGTTTQDTAGRKEISDELPPHSVHDAHAQAVHDNTAVKDESEKPPDGAQNDHLTSNDDNVHNKGGTNSSLNELNMTSDSLMEDPHCKTRAPQYFSNQLQQLKEICDAEAVRAQLGIMERRCRDLESRISEANEELARVRAEGRATEASLSAARRTEAALRRRLLVAMDVQGSGTGSNRYSMGATLNGAIDTRSPVELEAALIKYEAINNSLTEAAQLDRTRLHEQSLHIGQLEAERRTLYDRISTLQATEAGAQRGIVRLQALYEDMLREYSESRTQEMTLRSRERSQSNYRNKVDQDKNGQCTNKTRPHSTMNNLQERITKLEKENTSLKQALQLSEQNRQHPIGPCSFPACIKVRQLLQAFQDRFSNVVTQLCETRSYLDKQNFNRSIPSLSTNVVQPGDHKCINLVQSVRQQLVTLLDQVVGGQNVDDLVSSLTSCSATLQRLESWLQTYLDRTDTEVLQLREIILGLQVCEGEQTLETHCTDHVSRQPFSCSIRVNKKPNMDLLSQKEHEIVQLRRQIRELETDALVGGQNNMN